MDYRISDIQLTCNDLSSVDNCSNITRTSGCFCSNGNVLLNGVCIHPDVCPSKTYEKLLHKNCGLLHFVITFYVVPSTIITPMNSTVTIITEGDTTIITCEAVGYPPPTIVWSRTSGTLSDRVLVSNSVSVPTGSGNVTSVSVNLTLTNANRRDTGLYECSASNSVGSDNKNISITVQCKLQGICCLYTVTVLL